MAAVQLRKIAYDSMREAELGEIMREFLAMRIFVVLLDQHYRTIIYEFDLSSQSLKKLSVTGKMATVVEVYEAYQTLYLTDSFSGRFKLDETTGKISRVRGEVILDPNERYPKLIRYIKGAKLYQTKKGKEIEVDTGDYISENYVVSNERGRIRFTDIDTLASKTLEGYVAVDASVNHDYVLLLSEESGTYYLYQIGSERFTPLPELNGTNNIRIF